MICYVMSLCRVCLCSPTDCGPPGPSSMGFPRLGYWSGVSFPSPRDLLSAGIEPRSFPPPSLAVRSLTTSAPHPVGCPSSSDSELTCPLCWKRSSQESCRSLKPKPVTCGDSRSPVFLPTPKRLNIPAPGSELSLPAVPKKHLYFPNPVPFKDISSYTVSPNSYAEVL